MSESSGDWLQPTPPRPVRNSPGRDRWGRRPALTTEGYFRLWRVWRQGQIRPAQPPRSRGLRARESSGRQLRDSGAAAGSTSRGRGEGGAARRERTGAGPAEVRAEAEPAAGATGGRWVRGCGARRPRLGGAAGLAAPALTLQDEGRDLVWLWVSRKSRADVGFGNISDKLRGGPWPSCSPGSTGPVCPER